MKNLNLTYVLAVFSVFAIWSGIAMEKGVFLLDSKKAEMSQSVSPNINSCDSDHRRQPNEEKNPAIASTKAILVKEDNRKK